jgi:hypothetical protein
MFVFCNSLLAKETQEHFQLLYLGVYWFCSHINGRTEDYHRDCIDCNWRLKECVSDGQDRGDLFYDIVCSIEEVLYDWVVDWVGSFYIYDSLLEGRVETFEVCGEHRVHEGTVSTRYIAHETEQLWYGTDGERENLIDNIFVVGADVRLKRKV